MERATRLRPYIYHIYIYIESEKTPQKIHSNPQKVGRLNKMLLVVVNLAWISNGTGGVLLHTCSIQVEYQGGVVQRPLLPYGFS